MRSALIAVLPDRADIRTAAAGPDRAPVAVNGDKARLFPDGRWECVDAAKVAAAQQTAAAYPENRARPEGARGGLLVIGCTIEAGDKDCNRGSSNPRWH